MLHYVLLADNIQVLLGDRYGQSALLRTIPTSDFELFRDVAEEKIVKNGHLLHTWYERDENAVPPAYVFKVIVSTSPCCGRG